MICKYECKSFPSYDISAPFSQLSTPLSTTAWGAVGKMSVVGMVLGAIEPRAAAHFPSRERHTH